jgi:hypothetical protein
VQAKTEAVDGRADVFSLASVAYTLLTGQAAFFAPTIPGIVHRVVYEDPEPPSRFVRDLPPAVEHVLTRALAKDPAHRYPTAEAFAEDAEDVLAGQPPRHAASDDFVVVEGPDSVLSPLPPGDAARPMPADRPRRRLRRSVILAGVALGLSILWGLWQLGVPWSGPLSPRGPVARSPAPPPSRGAGPGPAVSRVPDNPGRLRIDFDHPLQSGTLRIFVDDKLALEERLAGQKRNKALVFKLHEGSFQDELEVPSGLHEVRVEVLWEDNVKRERIIGNFPPGATRRLEASLGRIRRDLQLEWK